MAHSTQTVTVDRVSNSGNPIAEETRNGKHIHVPSGLTGKSYEVRLEDRGTHYVARLVHQESGARNGGPTAPSSNSSSNALLELGEELLGGETLTMEQRECSDNRLKPSEYPGKDQRSEIAFRHD